MPPKKATTAAAAAAAAKAAAENKNKLEKEKLDNNQTVSLGTLKAYMKETNKEQTEEIRGMIEERFKTLQTEFIGQKKELAGIKRDSKSISTAVAANE